MINVAILGHGVVGSGVAEIMIGENQRICDKVREEISVKYILDLRDFNNLPYSEKFTKDFNIILNDPTVKIVAEAMGGLHPAFEFAKACLSAGKSFVTSNKELVAAKGDELFAIAESTNTNFLFEASVGGGIPILRPLAQCMAANEIQSITGILNGTTNYILNKMIMENMAFEDALALAQAKGYAEKDPTADIGGHDAARKIAILSSLAFGKHVYPEQVKTVGITDITLDDVEYADQFGYVIKLIGRTERLPMGKVTASVEPSLLPRSHILSNVNGVYNAIMVNGDETGDVMFFGKGAGKYATASAVVADIIDCAKHLQDRKYLGWEKGSDDYVVQPDSDVRLYVLARSADFNELCEVFDCVFPEVMSIKNKSKNEIAFITDKSSESDLMNRIKLLPTVGVKTMPLLFEEVQ